MNGRGPARPIALAGLILLSVLPYLPALKNGFVWDDQEFIVKNEVIREVFPLGRFFQRQGLVASGDIYPATGSRPLMAFSLALDHLAWKLDPFGYHLTNLIIHLACVLLAALLAYELTRLRAAAYLAAAVFSALPARAEAVIALLGRSDLLATFFVLIAFIAYLRSDRADRPAPAWYLISAVGFGLACLAKETGLSFVIMIAGYEFFLRPRRAFKQILFRILPFVAVAGAYWYYRGWVLQGNTSGLQWWGGTFHNNFLMALETYPEYLWLIVFPVMLSPVHMVPVPSGPFTFLGLLGLGLALAAVGLTAAAIRRDRIIGFGCLWFCAALLPVANILPIPGMIMAERWLYLPAAGLGLSCGLWTSRWLVTRPARTGALGWAGVLAVLTIWSARIFVWCPAWKSDESVSRAALRASPDSHMALNNLGKVLLVRGQIDEAEALFRRALEIKQDYGVAHLNLAMVLRDRGRMEEARAECLKAVEFSPDEPDAQNNLAVVLWRLADTLTSLEHFQEAIRLDPGSATYRFNYGLALNQLGRIEPALAQFRTVAGIDSNNIDARLYIGYALARLGRYAEAERELRRVIRMNRSLPDARYNLAACLEAQGRLAEAAEEYRAYLSCAPDAGNRSLVEEKIRKLGGHE